MIERYATPEMRELWGQDNRFATWLEIELLAVEAWADLGRVPREAARNIRARARFDSRRIEEIERTTDHDVIAFLTCVAERVGDDSRFIHLGLTSYDVVDTALSALCTRACGLLIVEAERLRASLLDRAGVYRHTPMIGRTHGVHAEPITLGLKLALWASEMDRNVERLKAARTRMAVGKLSGAVGTYANIDPRVERYVCERMGLEPAVISNQILQRDRHAELLMTLALAGASIEKFATEIRSLQRTEILELEEGFAPGQKGSSAMPHKRNPVTCERMCGLARVLRGNGLAGLENVALWNERDISHSSAERIVIPDSCTILHYMLRKFRDVVERLTVREDRMRANLELTRGLIFSEVVLLALVDKGLTREEAYALVQRNAMKAWEGRGEFRELLCADPDVTRAMSEGEVAACFDMGHFLKRTDEILARLGI